MPDLLVPLRGLPPLAPTLEAAAARGVKVRRALVPEAHVLTGWIERSFSPTWASEARVCFAHHPVSCHVAVERIDGAEAVPIGFACWDASARGLFGPIGVGDEARGRGVGRALLLSSLHAMAAFGYAYAVIGGAGPIEFFVQTVGAVPIEGSDPGLLEDRLR